MLQLYYALVHLLLLYGIIMPRILPAYLIAEIKIPTKLSDKSHC